MHTERATSALDEAEPAPPSPTNGERYDGNPPLESFLAGAIRPGVLPTELLATVAHELRNPVGCIKSAVQVLRLLSSLDSKSASTHDLIDRQVAHMTRLIEDLMDVVRLSEGKIVPRCDEIELGEIVRNSVEDCRARLDEAGLSLTLEWPSEQVCVEGDPGRVYQIFSNLLHNAIKFTETGGHITVSLLPGAATDAVVSIRDTGVGVDAEMLSHLFEPFTQSERTRDRSRGGLGLGLSLVRGLARLQGGDIEATSAGAGRGSEFRVRLARSPAVPAVVIPTQESPVEAFEDDGNPPPALR